MGIRKLIALSLQASLGIGVIFSALFLFTSLASAVVCPLPMGRPYLSGTSTVIHYVTNKCTVRDFPSPTVFKSWFPSFRLVKFASNKVMRRIPVDSQQIMGKKTAPSITTFTATPDPANVGDTVTLLWNVANSPTAITIDNNIGTVSGPTGSTQTTVTTDQPITYTLTAQNSTGKVTAQRIINKPRTCTSFTYSAWGDCQSNSLQTRTVLISSPLNCTGGTPVFSQSCVYTPAPTCQTLWWFDLAAPVCSQKQFCGAYMYNGLQTFATQAGCLAALPIVTSFSNIAVSNITLSGAIVSWNVSPASQGQVQYGLTANYGSVTTLETNALSYHAQAISGLTAGATYHYRVTDNAGAYSSDGVFTTSGGTAPTCTSFIYSAWGACQPNNTQTRTVLSSSPSGCTGGAPALDQTCNYALAISFSNIAVSNITSSGATVSWNVSPASQGQVQYGLTTSYGSATILETSALSYHAQLISGLTAGVTYHYRVIDNAGAYSSDGVFTTSGGTTPTCTSFTYSAWAPSVCSSNGLQTRTVTSQTPSGCTGGFPILSQTCTPPAPATYPIFLTITGQGSVTCNGGACSGEFSQGSVVAIVASPSTGYALSSWGGACTGISGNTCNLTVGTSNIVSVAFVSTPSATSFSAITVSNISSSGASISWNVSPASQGQIQYGLTASYGSLSTLETNALSYHAQNLSGLVSATTYHFRVTDNAGAYSSDGVFTTSGGSTTPTTCTSFTYSVWGTCQPNNTQTRTATSQSPSGCSGGNPTLDQPCPYVTPPPSSCGITLGGASWKGSTSLTTYPKAGYITSGGPIVDIDDNYNSRTPFQRLQDAVALLQSNALVLVRDNSGAVVNATGPISRSTAWSSAHQLYAYGSQRIKVNVAGITPPGGSDVAWLTLAGQNEYWKGFEITGGLYGWWEMVLMSGSYNRIEDFWIDHNAGGTNGTDGSQIRGQSVKLQGPHNRVQDVITWAITPMSGTGTHLPDPIAMQTNYSEIVRCLVFYGGDDAYDLWDSNYTTIVDSVAARSAFALNAGANPTAGNVSQNGDGNGFKLGGADSGFTSSNNSAIGSIAVMDRYFGFTFNDGGAVTLRNDTAWGNGRIANAYALGNVRNSGSDVVDGMISYGGGTSDETNGNSWSHSLTQSTDPKFCDTSNGDFSLCSGSPGIGTGTGGANLGASETALLLLKGNWNLLTNHNGTPANTYSCDGNSVTPPAPTCTSFTYSCGVCQANGTKTCTVQSSSPSGCTGGSPSLSQSCAVVPPAPFTYPVTVSIAGQGTVTCNGGACSNNFSQGAVVSIVATPATGYSLSSWGGACTGISGNTCNLTIGTSNNVSVTFAGASPPPPSGGVCGVSGSGACGTGGNHSPSWVTNVTGAGALLPSTANGVSVASYGAKGDCYSDDNAAFQSAITAAGPTKPLLIPALSGTCGPGVWSGTQRFYAVSGLLNVNTMSVMGTGGYAFIRSTSSDPNAILFKSHCGDTGYTTCTGQWFTGLKLDGGYDPTGQSFPGGTAANQAGVTIGLYSAKNVTIQDNLIQNSKADDIYLGVGGSGLSPSNVLIRGNTLLNPERCNIAYTAVVNSVAIDNIASKSNWFVYALDIEPDAGTPGVFNVEAAYNTWSLPATPKPATCGSSCDASGHYNANTYGSIASVTTGRADQGGTGYGGSIFLHHNTIPSGFNPNVSSYPSWFEPNWSGLGSSSWNHGSNSHGSAIYVWDNPSSAGTNSRGNCPSGGTCP